MPKSKTKANRPITTVDQLDIDEDERHGVMYVIVFHAYAGISVLPEKALAQWRSLDDENKAILAALASGVAMHGRNHKTDYDQ